MTPLAAPRGADEPAAHAFARDWARTRGLVAPGDFTVTVQGATPHHPGHNGMHVEVVT